MVNMVLCHRLSSGFALMALAAAVLVAGCQQANRSPWLSYTGPATNRGGVAYCRSALTGDTYTINGAGCSPGDTPVSASAVPATTFTPSEPKAAYAAASSTASTTRSTCQEFVESGSRRTTSIPDLMRTLAAQKSQKDEFETTAAYRARIDGQASIIKAALRSKTGSESVIVSVPVKADHARYDADREVLTVSATPSPVQTSRASDSASGSSYHTVFVTDVIAQDLDSYIGENAYGAKRKVIKLSQRYGGVAIARSNSILDATTWPSSGWSRSFNMSADDARAAKGNLRVLVIGGLNTPFLLTGYDGNNPTISNPVDITTVTHAVNLTPECIVLYDTRARKVLHSF